MLRLFVDGLSALCRDLVKARSDATRLRSPVKCSEKRIWNPKRSISIRDIK